MDAGLSPTDGVACSPLRGGTSSGYDPIDVTQYRFEEMKAVVDTAEDWNIYVIVHAYTPRAVRRAIDAGVKCIEHGQLLDEGRSE